MNRNGPKFAAHLSRLQMLALHLDNGNTWAEEEAADNLANNRPAFWSTSRYSNATIGIFLDALCRWQRIDLAIAECEKTMPHSPHSWRSEDLLDRLLPLNDPAIRELARAYEAIGSFRTPYELIRRTDRIEVAAMPAMSEVA